MTADLEAFYRDYHSDAINLPTEYPSGCLLGCVDVSNMASQEEYASAFPEGESTSPFVFICDNPQVQRQPLHYYYYFPLPFARILARFSHALLSPTPSITHRAAYSTCAYACAMLIGACNPMLCLIRGVQVLGLKFPVKGKHKIWKMEKELHDAAKAQAGPVDPGNVRPTGAK